MPKPDGRSELKEAIRKLSSNQYFEGYYNALVERYNIATNRLLVETNTDELRSLQGEARAYMFLIKEVDSNLKAIDKK